MLIGYYVLKERNGLIIVDILKVMQKWVMLLATILTLGACSPDPSPCVIKTSKLTNVKVEDLAELKGPDLAQIIDSLPEVPKDSVLITRENVLVVASPEARKYAYQQADLLQLCYTETSELTGITPIMDTFMQTVSVDGGLQELEKILCPKEGVGCNNIPTHYTPSGTSTYNYKKPTVCTFAHESTHLLLGGTVLDEINIFLNEGLAVFLQHYFNDKTTVVFHEHYWEESGTSNGEYFSRTGDYVDLDLNREEHKKRGTLRDAYVTGARFWDIIYQQDPQLFKDILKDVEASRMIPMSFIKDILVPKIGEDAVYELDTKVPGLIDAYLESSRIPQIQLLEQYGD